MLYLMVELSCRIEASHSYGWIPSDLDRPLAIKSYEKQKTVPFLRFVVPKLLFAKVFFFGGGGCEQ